MKTKTKDYHEELYGAPTSLRLPINLKKAIGEEAILRGQSLASYAADLLTSAYQKRLDQSSEISLLIREKSQLEQRLQKLEAEVAWQSLTDKKTLEKLMLNRTVLSRFIAVQVPILKQELEAAGFDFSFATNRAKSADKEYYCVFDHCYRLEGNIVEIQKMEE